ncbi:MAG TPA: MBL fold metallo-hydrolase [Gemmatimonadaceae bacterium]|nr:MBL fold metallo-hydrolase [Gemmatimonadaceae bacterium]
MSLTIAFVKRRTFLGAVAATSAASIVEHADAAPAKPTAPQEAKPTKIVLLGTGTPAPSLERAGSGYLFEVGGDTIVMDHGPDAHHRLLQSGRRAVDVSRVFFTHLHYDHCVDYARLVLQRWDQGADKIADLEVYGPPPIKRMTDQLFSRDGVFGADIRARIEHQSSIDVFRARGGATPRKWPVPRVREVQPGDVVEGNGWKVRVGRATHVQPFLECLAYRLDASDGSVCYTGDSGQSDEIVELARGCDVLIHMNHYFSGTAPTPAYRAACGNHKDNAVVAQRAGVKTLVLTHLLAQIDHPRIREQIVHEIQETFSGKVVWGEDLMELTFAGPTIANIEGY